MPAIQWPATATPITISAIMIVMRKEFDQGASGAVTPQTKEDFHFCTELIFPRRADPLLGKILPMQVAGDVKRDPVRI